MAKQQLREGKNDHRISPEGLVRAAGIVKRRSSRRHAKELRLALREAVIEKARRKRGA